MFFLQMLAKYNRQGFVAQILGVGLVVFTFDKGVGLKDLFIFLLLLSYKQKKYNCF
jgi:hypothetical protein